MNCKSIITSFRPLTGIMVLILGVGLYLGSTTPWSFPSPYGDYGSYRRIHTILADKVARKVSVPLRGLWFLSKTKTDKFTINLEMFPSPYGDYGSYRLQSPQGRNHEVLCFRPLTGIMVLIRTLYRWLYEAFEMAFCGADHIFSSFFVFYKKMIFKKSFGPEFSSSGEESSCFHFQKAS